MARVMQAFQQALTRVHPSSFNPQTSQHLQQLRSSSNVSNILKTIKENDRNVFIVHGEPGSGCTTLVQGLCRCLCNTETITESDILYLSLNQGCSKASLWDFMGKLAREKNDQESASKFTQISVKIDKKIKALSEFLEQHFKIICVDNADYYESWILDSSLGDVLKTCKVACLLVLQSRTHYLHRHPTNDIVSSIVSVNGLRESSAKALALTLLNPHILKDEDITSLCNFVKFNPFGIQLLCGLLKGQNENMMVFVLETLQNQHSSGLLDIQSLALDRVLELVRKALKVSSIDILYKLSHLRQPLPMLEMNSEIQELVLLKLLHVKKEKDGKVTCIYLHPTLKKYLSSKKNSPSCRETDFDVLQHWLSLVSNKDLQKLICEAENNDWPFVPEKWQFVQDVSKEQGTNVKDAIVSINTNIPALTELQILQECLYHSYIQHNFQKLAAVLFVLDRFLYWQGDAKTSMVIVTYIQKNSPQTAIAPQLLVRKARVLKNEGNLRVSEEILDEVARESHGVGRWKYKTRDQFQLTKAACIQLKGEIQYSLGNWLKSAELLLLSIELFATLARPDKKGLSLGYGLLCQCLRNMTVQDYSSLVDSFGLVQCHPLLAAYISAQEAARSSTYTPMFFVRHICHAGEVMMQLIKLSTLEDERQQLLKVAIEDIRDSIQSHQTYEALTMSREQFYIFVLASYKLSLALLDLKATAEQETGHKLNVISVELFEHYCSSSGHVIIDDHVTGLINKCLTLLGLEKFQDENLPNAGEVLLKYYTRRSDERLKENTRLTFMGLFAKGHAPLSPASPTIRDYPESSAGTRHHISGTNVDDSAQYRIHETVDRYAATMEEDTEEATSGVKQDSPSDGKTVDRCAATEEKDVEVIHSEKRRLGDGTTVERNAATVEDDAEAEHPDKDRPSGGATVGRTATAEEHVDATQPEKTRSGDGKSVDRNTATVEDYAKVKHQDKDRPSDGKTDDRYSATLEDDVEKTHLHKARLGDDKTADRNAAAKVGEDAEAEHQCQERLSGGKTVDRYSATLEEYVEETHPSKARLGDHKTAVDRNAAKVPTPEAEHRDKDSRSGGKTVDRYAATVEDDEEEIHPGKERSGDAGKNVERNLATLKDDAEKGQSDRNKPSGGETADRRAATVDGDEVDWAISVRSNTIDEYAFLLSRTVEGDSGVIIQSLKEEAVSLPSQTCELPRTIHSNSQYHGTKRDTQVLKTPRDAILWKYDYPSSQWRGQPTMVYIEDRLQLDKGKEGAQRDVFKAVFINQDEPLGRYVAKQYKKKVNLQQYENDVLSQMTARHYVTLFNQSLFHAAKGATVGEIQFLPVVLLQLFDSSGRVTDVFNAEPYMSGEFTKLTNNVDWINERRRTDLVLAYSHFTYQASNGNLIIVDIQGWAPHDDKGCTFLTDPQIHSTVYKCFGTGNLGKKGYQNFWKMHSKCTKICKMLGLNRPSVM